MCGVVWDVWWCVGDTSKACVGGKGHKIACVCRQAQARRGTRRQQAGPASGGLPGGGTYVSEPGGVQEDGEGGAVALIGGIKGGLEQLIQLVLRGGSGAGVFGYSFCFKPA